METTFRRRLSFYLVLSLSLYLSLARSFERVSKVWTETEFLDEDRELTQLTRFG